MKSVALGLIGLAAVSVAVSGCNDKRKATVDTGTAKATVTTTAPANLVPDSQLQQQAAQAATASSTPVDGTGPVNSIAPTTHTNATH